MTLKIRDGKEYLAQKTMAICNAYSKEVIGVVPSKSAQLNVCRSLSLLPAMMLALLKSVSRVCSNVRRVFILTVPCRKHSMALV